MRAAPEKLVALWLVFSLGVLAGVYGVVLFLLGHTVEPSLALAAGGLSLVGWTIFHPARALNTPGRR
jgi:hypothetical protein